MALMSVINVQPPTHSHHLLNRHSKTHARSIKSELPEDLPPGRNPSSSIETSPARTSSPFFPPAPSSPDAHSLGYSLPGADSTTITDVRPPAETDAAMSGYYYMPDDEEEQPPLQPRYTVDYRQPPPARYNVNANNPFPSYTMAPTTTAQLPQQQRYMVNPQSLMQSPPQPYQYPSTMLSSAQQQSWTLPSQPPTTYGYPGYQQPSQSYPTQFSVMPQSLNEPSAGYLSPPPVLAGPSRPRPTRTASNASHASSVSYNTDGSRGGSPSAAEMARWGTRNRDGSWSCSYKGCTSRSTFTRGCDLRKHYKRHTKSLFCRYDGCPQATSGGFSSNKDRTRHEQKHNPNVACEWPGCDRMFSRVDNMKDHVRRVHLKYSSMD